MADHLYAITSGNITSGGPELMHQLVDAVNGAGGAASIVYYPFDRDFAVPEPYRSYDVPVARWTDVPRDARVVVPETFGELLPRLVGYRTYFWWLSVDLYFRSLVTGEVRRRIPSGLLPLARRVARWYPVAFAIGRITARRAGDTQRRETQKFAGVHCHLFQSEYARLFLADRGWGPAEHLGDYVNQSYLEDAGGHPADAREDLVAYNPAKGFEQTQAIVEAVRARAGDRVTFVPLVGMTRDGVRDILGRAKLYIDFGYHPGRDRFPREAAIMGACVLTNRRGSAANAVDVPLPDAYKVDDAQPAFADAAADIILDVMSDFGRHHAVFEAYRRTIATEPEVFRQDVRRLFLP
jgi:hypothetical protein